jgi:Na+/pantothenate symporter
MISYGDIAANNPEETVYALLCFCFSFLTYSYMVNSIVGVILDTRNARDNFKAELIFYTTYMEILALSKEHQYDFREYLESQFFEERERKHALEEEMKARLPA